jgi:hypothetical protein
LGSGKSKVAFEKHSFLLDAGFFISGIVMLEVMEIEFTGAEVKRIKRNVPNEVDVNVNIDKITRKDNGAVTLDFTYAVDYTSGQASST